MFSILKLYRGSLKGNEHLCHHGLVLQTCFGPQSQGSLSRGSSVSVESGCRLGGVVVSVLPTGPKGCGFEPGQGDGFLRAIKIRCTPSFG
jgi:hypothetical protein